MRKWQAYLEYEEINDNFKAVLKSELTKHVKKL